MTEDELQLEEEEEEERRRNWRTFDLQVSYTVRGRPMTTGAQRGEDHGQASTSFCWWRRRRGGVVG